MDIEELTASLGDPAHVPEPDTVMAALARKHRRRVRQRWSVAGGCAVTAAVVAAVAVLPRTPHDAASSASSSGPVASGPAASGHSAAGGSGPARQRMSAGTTQALADACTPMSLARRATAAARSGGSVVVADASAPAPAASGREPVVLRDVQTLRGPRIASGTAGYAVAAFTPGGLGGQVFAIVLPGGEVLAAPVSHGTVRFGAAGCWATADMPLPAAELLATGK